MRSPRRRCLGKVALQLLQLTSQDVPELIWLETIARTALGIAGDICIYTNTNMAVLTLPPEA